MHEESSASGPGETTSYADVGLRRALGQLQPEEDARRGDVRDEGRRYAYM